jgi:hypothetical protein
MIYAILIALFSALALFYVALNAGIEDARGHFDGALGLLCLGVLTSVVAIIGLWLS